MSKIIKIAYRGIGGFFADIFMFVFGVIGISLLVAETGVITGAVYMLINPNKINDVSFG